MICILLDEPVFNYLNIKTCSSTFAAHLGEFIYEGKHIFDSDQGVCMVSPTHGSLHTIRAVNG